MGSRVRDIASKFERAAGSELADDSSGQRPAPDEGASSTRGGPRRSSTFDPLGTTTTSRHALRSTSTAPGRNRRTPTLPLQLASGSSSPVLASTAAARPRELTRPSPTSPPSPHPLFRPSPPRIRTNGTAGPVSLARGSPLRSAPAPKATATSAAPHPVPHRTSLPNATLDPPRPAAKSPTIVVAPSSSPSPEPPSYKSFASSSSLSTPALVPPAPTTRPIIEASRPKPSAIASSSTSIDGLPPLCRGDHPLLSAPATSPLPFEAPAPLRVNLNLPSSSTASSSTPPPTFSPSPSSASDSKSIKKAPSSNPPSFHSRESPVPSSSRRTATPSSSVPHNADQHPQYNPLPPAEVFSRSSLPLSIPHLDQYLASLVPPDFPPLRGAGVDGKAVGSGLFPPFDLLATKDGLGGEAVAVPGEWIRRGTWNLGEFCFVLGADMAWRSLTLFESEFPKSASSGSSMLGHGRSRCSIRSPTGRLEQRYVCFARLGISCYLPHVVDQDPYPSLDPPPQGSNFMSSLYSLEGAYGAVQVLALVLGSVGERQALTFSLIRQDR